MTYLELFHDAPKQVPVWFTNFFRSEFIPELMDVEGPDGTAIIQYINKRGVAPTEGEDGKMTVPVIEPEPWHEAVDEYVQNNTFWLTKMEGETMFAWKDHYAKACLEKANIYEISKQG